VTFFLLVLAGCSGRALRDTASDGGPPAGDARGLDTGGGNGGGGNGGGDNGGSGGAAAGGGGGSGAGGQGGLAVSELDACGDTWGVCESGSPPCSCRDDPRPGCGTIVACARNLQWQPQVVACPEQEPTSCPPTIEAANQQLCFPRGAACAYPGNVHCYCAAPADFGSYDPCGHRLVWYCGHDYLPECPRGVPDLGSACATEHLKCGWSCFNRYARDCEGGVWVPGTYDGECV